MTSYVVGVGDEVLIGCIVILILVYLLYQVMVQIIPTNDGAPNAEDLTSGRIRAQMHDCSICLGEAQLAIQPNCGHVYCGQCIISYYDTATRGKYTASKKSFSVLLCME